MTSLDGLTLRPVAEEEFSAWARTTEAPFFEDVSDEQIQRWRKVVELERSLGVFDGTRIVGGSLLLRMAVTVPGGELQMGGLTAVGVLPTHRRRGLLTALMQRHTEDLREWGEPLGGLYAAEYPIYARFGYGSAAPEMHWTISRQHTAFLPGVETSGEVELVDADVAVRDFPAIHEAVRAQRPGMPHLNAAVWHRWAADSPDYREGFSPKYLARLGDRGYVAYRASTQHWEHGLPAGTMQVLEHMAVDAAAAATLWRYLFDHDLIETFKLPRRPTDDLLPLFLVNPRGLVGWQYDGMWLRPIDIPSVLGGRTYAVDDGLTIGVVDGRLPDNTASWALEGGPEGAQCRRSDAEPDLRVEVGDLGGAYLGSLKFRRLVRAGRAEEHTPGAAARADLMFATDPAPWCHWEF